MLRRKMGGAVRGVELVEGIGESIRAPVRPVILCGGSGSRLWPLSRSLHPKQLLPLAAGETMLQATAARISGPMFSAPLVVSGEDHRFLIRDQLEAIGIEPSALILEPAARNTAAAIAVAAHSAGSENPSQVMLVLPSDHLIADVPRFLEAVAAAVPAAEAGALVTFGIEPRHPETGYGYIEAAETSEIAPGVLAVTTFSEKPDLATAERYCASGRHFWNGGIFLFRADIFLSELEAFAPEIATACKHAVDRGTMDGDFFRPGDDFLSAPSISVDYAVMERTGRAAVVPVRMGWSDVGSWHALWEVQTQDSRQNVLQGEVVALDCGGSLLRSEDGITVAAVGVEDMVVVATRDAVLVVPRDRAQDIKLLVDRLRAEGNGLHAAHHRVHRPWGTYETTDRGERFQTKRIVVKPGHKLSLQMHHHRSEHWIVVRGTARVTVGDSVRLLQENESTYVAAGCTHRLENPGKIPLELIEVQCGPYVGEDDIVRFDDTYGRVASIAGA